MVRIGNIKLKLDYTPEDLHRLAASKLGAGAVDSVRLSRLAVDARDRRDVHFVANLDVELRRGAAVRRNANVTMLEPAVPRIPVPANLSERPVVVGFGPAGMFAALTLARRGACPIVLERGDDCDRRTAAVDRFTGGGALDEDSNVQFGEGGAGTFSDGKLNTGIKDPRCREVLETMVEFGAPAEILYLAKPHVGTDRLCGIVKTLRQQVIALGGEVRFRTKLTAIEENNGKVCAVRAVCDGREVRIATHHVVLALGHSARDTFAMLESMGLPMAPKPFSVGVRIEHLRRDIDRAQYGSFAGHPALGAADYKLAVHLPDGRGVYTFCMCPGGYVMAAASEHGGVVTNGMSRYARDAENSNAAVLVGITPEDFGHPGPLGGIAFQRELERRAFAAGGATYRAPAQRFGDFLANCPTAGWGRVSPSYRPGVQGADLNTCLPPFIADALRQGIGQMGRYLNGFDSPDAVLTGVESRSSSPVRIVRDAQLQSPALRGLYPCGEGAGYAGGIMSAAVDGMRVGEQIGGTNDENP